MIGDKVGQNVIPATITVSQESKREIISVLGNDVVG